VLLAQHGEDERAFRARLALQGREARDAELAEISESIGKKLATLDERIRKKQNTVAAGEDQSRYGYAEALVDVFARGPGAAVKRVGRAATKAKSTAREKEDLESLLQKRRELETQWRAAIAEVTARTDPATVPLETIVSKPKKTGITVHLVALAWRAD